VKNLGSFKREILRCTQNDKYKFFDCSWYHSRRRDYFTLCRHVAFGQVFQD
jgi:hypothetical protein